MLLPADIPKLHLVRSVRHAPTRAAAMTGCAELKVAERSKRARLCNGCGVAFRLTRESCRGLRAGETTGRT
jgi:hypothetical protein